MAIGDVTSNERGSGARFNSGKPAMSLLPLRSLADSYSESPFAPVLYALADWQEGRGVEALEAAAETLAGIQGVSMAQAWADCARVFEYGRNKYAAWNWAKGMAWSIPLECAVRHLLFGIMEGEENDYESGQPHRGHFMCNLAMLTTFARTFPEGDDRPVNWLNMPASKALGMVEMAPPIIPHDLAKQMLRDGIVPNTATNVPNSGADAHHATEAPMPPHLAERLDGRDDDEGQPYDVSSDPAYAVGGTD